MGGQLESVRACLDNGTCSQMQQFSGATWTGCPTGTGASMTFELTQRSPSGATASISCECPGEWPWPTGERCTCPTNFVLGADGQTGTSPLTTARQSTPTTPAQLMSTEKTTTPAVQTTAAVVV